MGDAQRFCFHCQEPVPVNCGLAVLVDDVAQPVCCSGCAAVAGLILDSGLSGYYRFRTATALKPVAAAPEVEESWQSLDERTSMWGERTADGRFELLLQTEGIRCAACAWLIRSQLEARRGIDRVQVDVATGFVRITWHPEVLRLSNIAGLLAAIGYRPHLPLSTAGILARQQERRQALKRLGVAGLGMMQVMMYAVALYAGAASGISAGPERFLQWVSLLVTTPVVVYSGAVFYSGAWRSLRARRVGMDVPVALAISVAFAASCFNFLTGSGHVYFDSVVMFVFFLSLGRYAELVIRQRNLHTGLALARLLPEWAEQITADGIRQLPAADLRVGTRCRVRAGQPFPADGHVIKGATSVDEALLTGESHAVDKRAGDKVIAGSINRSQPVDIEVCSDPTDSTVSVIGRLLMKSQTHRSRFTQVSEQYAGWFVALILLVAASTALWWLRHDASMLLPATLAVLVISCPCALSLATPAAIASASRALVERGVLLTRGVALEALAAVDTVIFDKTGTLTTGSLQLVQTAVNPDRRNFARATVLEIAAALEAGSAHPVASAFSSIPTGQPTHGQVINHDNGVEGRIKGHAYRLGNAIFVGVDDHLRDEQAKPGQGRVWLADERGWIARFELLDTLRPGVSSTIRALQARGLDTIILSGDHPEAVAAVARRSGIKTWLAEQGPEQKMSFLENLQASGRHVLMIGDGINDAPVLSTANVSMTVSGASELANSTADFILTGDSLALVDEVFTSANASHRVILQNLSWALVYNLVAVPLAAAGFIVPWMAALGMSLSSLLVVLNSGRLARRDRAEYLPLKTRALQP